ncbi:hypothetical protein [Brachybacterium sacelli]|uniref:Thioredoxin n=1 Tax=Brachybacterium sacelli TaxID=173364 RepID=A0ABS4WXV1_9MICO|nr:hypothetical protein [Brachybacterium sacelli]MBP2380798.1 hypothetical protein [Brachybacterium sacelli]
MSTADGDLDPTSGPEVAVVLVTADWSAPARPAPTVLRELARRWGPAVRALVLKDADDGVLETLDVSSIPTWLRFTRVETEGEPRDPSAPVVRDLRGADLAGEDVVLPGAWELTHRRSGAVPKHIVAEEFGPQDAASG